MQRFFVNFELLHDIILEEKEIVHQIGRVLRSKPWDHVILFNGDLSETEYEIQVIEKNRIFLRGVARRFPQTEPKKHITLFQALPNKHEKIEYIIEKWIEVGISRFVFFQSERSQPLIISDTKKKRFFSIAKEATEQCFGISIPDIIFYEKYNILLEKKFEEWLQHIGLHTLWDEKKVREFLNMQKIWLWTGPEGGWSPKEVEKMIQYDFIIAHFWERVFRTETAWPIVSFSFIHG